MAERRGRKPGLNPKQEKFCREYVVDLNARAAAIRAGYKESDAGPAACKLLKLPHVKALIAELKGKQFKRLELSADNVLQELSKVGFVDPAGLFNLDGVMLPVHEIPEDIRRAISSFEVETLYAGIGAARVEVGRVMKVKFWSKSHALDTLGKHFKLWVEQLEIRGRVDVADALRKARERRVKALEAKEGPGK